VETKVIVQLKKKFARRCRRLVLAPQRVYVVLQISDRSIRLQNDAGDPVLYNSRYFDIIDQKIPADWLMRTSPDGGIYAGPAFLPEYCWEDYHDGVSTAVAAVRLYLDRIGATSWVVT
jgi:hypothetical protein